MDDPLIERLSELAPDVDVVAARVSFGRRRHRRQQWFRATFGIVLVAALAGAVATVRTIADDPDLIVMTDTSTPLAPSTAPLPTVTSSTDSPSATTSPDVSPSPSVASAETSVPPSASMGAMTVSPFGVSSNDTSLRISESEIETRPVRAPGQIVVSYQLQLGLFPLPNPATLVPPTTTQDGQLSVAVECATPDCSIEPINDEFQTSIGLVVRTTEQPLTRGVHTAPFTVEYTNGTTSQFDVQFYAQPAASDAVSDLVATSTGEPEVVQLVFGVGRFAYHAISAFDSIWIVGKNSNTVARIDATTGELVATIPLGPPNSLPNRLAAGSDAVYAAGTPTVRIDPANNTTTRIDGGIDAFAVTAQGTTSWAAGREGIQRIDADGTITTLDVPDHPWFDLAVANGTVWALSQQRGGGTLLAFDSDTGAIQHIETLSLDDNEFAVRLVADGDQIIIGTDTSGGGGRTGRLLVYDADTATQVNSVTLDSRPEGIVVTDRYIWTSSAIIDRATLTVQVDNAGFGFTITSGPDGSIWATTGLPSSGTAEGVATRWAPGDYTG